MFLHPKTRRYAGIEGVGVEDCRADKEAGRIVLEDKKHEIPTINLDSPHILTGQFKVADSLEASSQ